MACFRGKENRAGRTSPKIFTKPVSMYINITTTETGNNKGSSGGLVQYLEKENRNSWNRKSHYSLNTGLTASEAISSHMRSVKRSTTTSVSSQKTTTNFSWSISRSEEHTSELQSLMRTSYAIFCL